MFKILLFSIFFFFISINKSFAYLDPGTGSMILQIIAAVAASTFIFIGLIWDKVKNFLLIIKKIFLKKNNNGHKK